MQTLRPIFTKFGYGLAGTICLAAAVSLSGCASKNPLMEEAAGGSTKPAAVVTSTDVKPVAPSRVQRFFGIFSPHRIDVQQGNFVSLEMMAQLKEGMKRPEGVSREQVRFALGTPLLTDIFHADRWDYVFRLQKGNGDLISSHVSLFFKDNRLVRFDGSVLPTEKEYLAMIAGSAPAAPAAPAASTQQK